MGDEVTLGELARRIEAMERRIDVRFSVIDRRLESLQFITADRYNAEQIAVHAEIAEIKDKIKWVSRTIGGVLITLVSSAVLTLLAARGGL